MIEWAAQFPLHFGTSQAPSLASVNLADALFSHEPLQSFLQRITNDNGILEKCLRLKAMRHGRFCGNTRCFEMLVCDGCEDMKCFKCWKNDCILTPPKGTPGCSAHYCKPPACSEQDIGRAVCRLEDGVFGAVTKFVKGEASQKELDEWTIQWNSDGSVGSPSSGSNWSNFQFAILR